MADKRTWIDQILQNRPLLHTFYWLGVFLYYPVYAGMMDQPWYDSMLIKACFLPGQVLAAYWLIYFQIPRYIYTRKYWRFAASFGWSLFVFSTLAHIIDDFVIANILQAYHPPHTLVGILQDAFYPGYLITAYLVPVVTAGGKMVKDRLAARQELEKLQKEKVQAELNFLKAQIHPHFLFNTLETLYDLTLQGAEEAPEVVVKLSEMLDYMLYESNGATVLVAEEVALIQNYFDLERLRYGDRLDSYLSYESDDTAAEIAPLLLLSLVEQAFKYGVRQDLPERRIHILVRVERGKLEMTVLSNQTWLGEEDKAVEKMSRDRTGKQLDLSYPGRYHTLVEAQNPGICTRLVLDL